MMMENLKEHLQQLEESHTGLEVRRSKEKLDAIFVFLNWQLYFHQGTITPLQLTSFTGKVST